VKRLFTDFKRFHLSMLKKKLRGRFRTAHKKGRGGGEAGRRKNRILVAIFQAAALQSWRGKGKGKKEERVNGGTSCGAVSEPAAYGNRIRDASASRFGKVMKEGKKKKRKNGAAPSSPNST